MNDTKCSLLDPFNLEVKIRKQLYPRSAISHSFVAIKVNQCYLHLGPNRIFILESMIGKTTLTSYENEVSFDEVETTTDCEVEKQNDSELYYPLDQTVFKLCVSPFSLGTSIWPEENNSQLVQYSMKTKLSLEYVDYAFLGAHKFLKTTIGITLGKIVVR